LEIMKARRWLIVWIVTIIISYMVTLRCRAWFRADFNHIGSANCFLVKGKRIFYLGTICRFSWNGTDMSHWGLHDNRHMNTSADVSKFQILPVHFKCWILLKPVLGGVDGNLHIPLSSMNRLNQTESETFSILSLCTFFRDSLFLSILSPHQRCLCRVEARKYNQGSYIFDP
jgi:hypothetical protein